MDSRQQEQPHRVHSSSSFLAPTYSPPPALLHSYCLLLPFIDLDESTYVESYISRLLCLGRFRRCLVAFYEFSFSFSYLNSIKTRGY